jgi:hypothetical protein
MKPIRIVFCKNDGSPIVLPGDRPHEKLWTAHGHHWISSDGLFPYGDCRTYHIRDVGAASVLSAIPDRFGQMHVHPQLLVKAEE